MEKTAVFSKDRWVALFRSVGIDDDALAHRFRA